MPRALVPISLFGLAAFLRIHNAWDALPLSGFDGPYHGAYIGAIHWEGRFQAPHWFTNHPPLYYGLSALLWQILPGDWSARTVLFALRLLNVASGLILGAAVWASARRLFPDRPALGHYALAMALFLPMLIGPSSVLGNQIMAAALGALTVALILRALDEPTALHAVLAGAVGGLGMLTKLSVLLVVAAGCGALLLRGVQRHGRQPAAVGLAILLGSASLTVASPYLIQNLLQRGAAVDPAIDIWAGVDRSQGRHGRSWEAYVDPNPGSLLVPGTFDERAQSAVWPVTFGSTWFDAFGTVLDVHHPNAQRMSQVLFAFGAVLTLAAFGGAAAALRGAGSAVPCGLVALGLLVLLNLISYVAFTREVATLSALKGTYWSPAVTAFVVFAALGLDEFARRWPALRKPLGALLATFALAVSATFWQGGLAPMRVNPADFYLQDYSDPPTLQAFRYFNGRLPSVHWRPGDGSGPPGPNGQSPPFSD